MRCGYGYGVEEDGGMEGMEGQLCREWTTGEGRGVREERLERASTARCGEARGQDGEDAGDARSRI